MPSKVTPALKPIYDWFHSQGWKPLPFQVETWQKQLDGQSGLIQVATGSGKTYAAFMGPFARLLAEPRKGLRILYLTPLRSVSRDIERSLQRPIDEMKWKFRVESRTGDTSSTRKSKQRKNPPEVLITTPESLSLMLSYENSTDFFSNLDFVIVDEWHELLQSKRGTMTELCLAHLRKIRPQLQTWGMSASIGNSEEAARALIGNKADFTLVTSDIRREISIETLLPKKVDTFPWAGHLGLHMLPELVAKLDTDVSTLIFTNTRSQCERWYQALTIALPEFASKIAIHHSSIDRDEREFIEGAMKAGFLKWVVCTSSLDLGVDFSPVERVVQIGSAKAVSRLIQRAGRSHHSPKKKSKVLFVPTHALELIEVAALRKALKEGVIESRTPVHKPFDVLAQHLVTLACGDGFSPDSIFEEITSTYSYRNLTREEFSQTLKFIERGGETLQSYPEYHKIRLEGTEYGPLYKVRMPQIAKFHRLSIGTITSYASVQLRLRNRSRIGTIEENFIAKLKPGDVFYFSGRPLRMVRIFNSEAIVEPAHTRTNNIPSWAGSKFPVSASVSHFVRHELGTGMKDSSRAEQKIIAPIIEAQGEVSRVPTEKEMLIELFRSREGAHMFIFPFEGAHIHEAFGTLWTRRLTELTKASFSVSVNDYGIEILCSDRDFQFPDYFNTTFFESKHIDELILSSMNVTELIRRKFREIAEVAGLIAPTYPGAQTNRRHVTASGGILFDVFRKYDSDHLLLKQAHREVLEQMFEKTRLIASLDRMSALKIAWTTTARPSPLAFPLMIERLSDRISSETLTDRIQRMKKQWTSMETRA